MRFMTMNLYSPTNPDWRERRQVLQAGFAELAPDIVAVQEARWGGGVDPVADLLGDGYHAIAHPNTSTDGVGAFLASRYPLELVSFIDLRITERVTLPWAGAVIAAVKTPEEFGDLLVVHYKPTWEIGMSLEREQQAVACAGAIEELMVSRSAHLVVLGDFDDEPCSGSMRFWRGQQSLDGMSVGYRDVWEAAHPIEPGVTFSASNELVRRGEFPHETGRRIDYILIRCDRHGPTLAVDACFRVFDTPSDGVWASDHFGVVADLAPGHVWCR
jgi:endonuclease/exonuclease/phosphatase family metal-dependent hydrolase